jgi:hypothetical protein
MRDLIKTNRAIGEYAVRSDRQTRLRVRFRRCGGTCCGLASDLVVDLFSMNRNVLRRFDPEANLVPSNFDHRHLNIIVDDDAFVALSR